MDTIKIDGKEYKLVEVTKTCSRKIVRSHMAGVYFGEIESKNGRSVVMTNARKIWGWHGAATLSELAMRGTSQPKKCKFPVTVSRVEILQVEEIIDVTDEAAASIDGVPVWSV